MKNEQNENCHRGGEKSSSDKNILEVPMMPPTTTSNVTPDEVPRRDGPGGEDGK